MITRIPVALQSPSGANGVVERRDVLARKRVDAQLEKLPWEEKKHRALAALHELMAVEVQAKQEGLDKAVKESLKRMRKNVSLMERSARRGWTM